MNRILVYCDGLEYIWSDPYQSQLHKQLAADHIVTYVTEASAGCSADYDAIFCCKRVRDIVRNPSALRAVTRGRSVIVQDYDPWRFLPIDAPFAGGYQKIVDALDGKCKFFIPSGCWTSIAAGQGVPVTPFAPIGMAPDMCSEGLPWAQRKFDLEFRGSVYPEREDGFRMLTEAGLHVPRPPKVSPYSAFLEHLGNLRVWCHHESAKFMLSGTRPNYDSWCTAEWLWPKTCEVLARGCFVVRNAQDEMYHYDLHEIPTLVTYTDVKDAKSKVDWILSLPAEKADEMIREAVAKMRAKDPYRYISGKIVEWYST